jgi:hypothetical protein
LVVAIRALIKLTGFDNTITTRTAAGTPKPLRPTPFEQGNSTLALAAVMFIQINQAVTFLKLYFIFAHYQPPAFSHFF